MRGEFHIKQESISAYPGRKWLILSTVLLGATMSALDVSIVNVAMPTLTSTFGVSMAVIEWITMAYMLTLTIFLPLFGRLSDMFGRSRLYNIGFIVFSAGSLLCGLSPSAGFMIAARIAQAVGAGLLQANSVALITQAFPSDERGKAIGIQGAVQAVAMAIGPFVGGVLIATAGWRSIFYINIPIGIMGTVAALFILPADGKSAEKEKIDYLGAALFASGLALLMLAFNEGVKLGWGSHTIITYFVSGSVLLSFFVITELRVKHPLIDLRLFKNPNFLFGNLTGMMSYYVLFAIMFLMPFYFQRVLGFSVLLTGVLLTPLLLAMAAVAPFSGYISDKYGPRMMTTLGMIISALACLSLLFVGESSRLPLLVGAMIVLGLGMGLFTPSNNSAIMGAAPRDKLGVAGGLLNMTRSLGLILGVNLSGVIFTSLEHQYLASRGYRDAHNIFSSAAIPMPLKANAFMHGFVMVITILLAVNLLSAVISASRTIKRVSIIDHEMAGTVVIGSGFFNGFNQEMAGMAILVALLLSAGLIGSFASTGAWSGGVFSGQAIHQTAGESGISARQEPLDGAKGLALSYYEKKYHDANVTVDVRREDGTVEADIRKHGFLVKELSIKGDSVTEKRTGMRDWAYDLFTNTY